MSLHDLIAAETPLCWVADTRGGEYAGPCPWCGGRDRFRVWPEADKPGYWCRQCGKHGDAIQYLRDRLGLSYPEACERLCLPAKPRTLWPRFPPTAPKPPSDTWQARALEVIEVSERRLWSPIGANALAYLRRRGFREATIRHARLGYQSHELRDAPERWAIPPDHRPVWLPRGIVIPVLHGEAVWMLWIRRPVGEPKYLAVAGSKHHDVGTEAVRFGHPAVLLEGIFDRLAVQQEADDMVTPVAVGTRHGTPRTVGKLALAKPVLLSLDADDAGDRAAAWWQRIFPQARRCRPTRKDPGEMLERGDDVRAWVAAAIADGADSRSHEQRSLPGVWVW
jgi:hypothetical protein